jgi:CheY-like chemotaxis protein/signal transduction histidine kinase
MDTILKDVASTRERVSSDAVNILVVDDRPENLLALGAILEPLGKKMVFARSGEEALKRVLEQDFAVILLDVHMPNMDGLETAALIRERKRSSATPIIFITAYADDLHVAKGYSLGAVDYIFSPVVAEILQAKVKVFVELFRMTQEVKEQADQKVAFAREQAARAAAEDSHRRAEFLAEAGRTLAASLDFNETIGTVTIVPLPKLGDFSALTLLDESGQVQRAEAAWVENIAPPQRASINLTRENDFNRGVESSIAARKSVLLKDLEVQISAGSDFESGPDSSTGVSSRKQLHCALFIPLLARSRTLGVLTLGGFASRASFSDSDVRLAEDLADRAALALDKALLYQEILDSDRRKTEFLAMLGHELRNPLTPIQYALEIASLNGSDPVKANWAKGVLKRQVKQLTRLVDDLLDISRITQGKIQLQLAPVDVSQVIEAAVETSRPLIEMRNHQLEVTPPSERILINADSARVAQVLSNLLNNAAKFTRKGGRISLSAHRERDEVLFRVKDNGIGLAQGMNARIFEPFTQGEAPDSMQQGLGIGLMLVRRLVEIQGGTVSASSPGLNQGSEFTVRLPLLSGENGLAHGQGLEADDPSGRNRLRVMVVDDDTDVADSTAELLRLRGYEVEIAYNGIEALRSVLAFRPDIIMLDLGMPEMNGFEVARRIKQQANKIQPLLIAVSGYGQQEYLTRAREAGFDHWLTKPVDSANLASLLANLYFSRPSQAAR